MLLEITCPKCGASTDIEPNASGPCGKCGAPLVGWVQKSGKSESNPLPKHKQVIGAPRKNGASFFALILGALGIVCIIFVNLWIGIIIIALGAILGVLANK